MLSGLFPATRWTMVRLLDAEANPGPDSAARILSTYANAIHRYLACKMPAERTTGQLEDIVQEVLVELLTHPDRLARARQDHPGRFRYLLMHLAWNAARNARRRLRDHPLPLPASTEPSAPPEHDPAADQAWRASLIDQAWRDLQGWVEQGTEPADLLAVAQDHLLHHLPLRTIAQRRQASLATCARRLARARHLLRQSLIDHLVASGDILATADASAAAEKLLLG